MYSYNLYIYAGARCQKNLFSAAQVYLTYMGFHHIANFPMVAQSPYYMYIYAAPGPGVKQAYDTHELSAIVSCTNPFALLCTLQIMACFPMFYQSALSVGHY